MLLGVMLVKYAKYCTLLAMATLADFCTAGAFLLMMFVPRFMRSDGFAQAIIYIYIYMQATA